MDFLAYNKAKLKIGELIRSREPVDIYALENLIEFVVDYENYVNWLTSASLKTLSLAETDV